MSAYLAVCAGTASYPMTFVHSTRLGTILRQTAVFFTAMFFFARNCLPYKKSNLRGSLMKEVQTI